MMTWIQFIIPVLAICIAAMAVWVAYIFCKLVRHSRCLDQLMDRANSDRENSQRERLEDHIDFKIAMSKLGEE